MYTSIIEEGNFKLTYLEDLYNRKTDHDNKSFYWEDIKELLYGKEIIIITELIVPKELRNKGIATEKLKQFCNKYNDTVILVVSGALISEYPEEPTDEEFKNILSRLDRFYTNRGFTNINQYTKTYEFKELYVYTGTDIGKDAVEKIKNYYKEG